MKMTFEGDLSGFLFGVAFLFLLLFLLFLARESPDVKSEKERNKEAIYEERCNIFYRNKYFPVYAGSNLRIGRVSFYENFISISFLGVTHIPYEEIELKIREKFLLFFGEYFILSRYGSRIKIIIKPNNFPQMKSIFLEKLAGCDK